MYIDVLYITAWANIVQQKTINFVHLIVMFFFYEQAKKTKMSWKK